MSNHPPDRAEAIALLRGLVSIPSISRQEGQASRWLVEQMGALGYDRVQVDEVGNAVGEIGSVDASHTLLLLGHIDTVPGHVPVRVEATDDGEILYGRGTVDAKGPLASFVAAGARVGSEWAAAHNLRLVVVGAVEEEAATSRGARFIRDRFAGVADPVPDGCIIGEPSHWRRVTLGYKGRLLVSLDASQPVAHTAGPDAGVATVAVDFWNWITNYCTHFNEGRDRPFDQLLPSLRMLETASDEGLLDRVRAEAGIRLPLDFDARDLAAALLAWAQTRAGIEAGVPMKTIDTISPDLDGHHVVEGAYCTIELAFRGYEAAWRSERQTDLVRSFLAAIRDVAPGTRPSFVVKTGTSDMNVVGPAWGCPILAYGPGDSSLDHTPNEHVALDEYWRAVLVLERAIRNWTLGRA